MQETYVKDKVDIITVSYNALDILPRFFSSLNTIEYPHIQIHFFDNASVDGSADWVKINYPETAVYKSDVNLFFCESNNYAL